MSFSRGPWTRVIGAVGIGLASLLAAATSVAAASPGDLDPSFGGDGLRWVDFSGREDDSQAVFRDSRGRLTLVGRSHAPLPKRDSRFVATRLLPDGRVDRSYGSKGRVIIDPTTQEDYLAAAARATDGSIVMLGTRWGSPRPHGNLRLGYVLVRITAGGHIDRSFGTRGVVIGSFSGTARYQDAVDVLVLEARGVRDASGDHA
jgi:hypothetical protein